MAAVNSFEEALNAAREMCAAARAARLLAPMSGTDPAEVAKAAREAVAACDDALSRGRAAMKGLGSDGDVAAAMERLTAAEAEAEAARESAEALGSRMSAEAGLLARKVMQAKSRAFLIKQSFGTPDGAIEGALAEAKRALALARDRLREASDMSSITEPWAPTDEEAAAIKAHNDAVDAHGRIRSSMLAHSPEARRVAEERGVRVVAVETNPSLPSLARHRMSVFEKISIFAKGRDIAQKAVQDAEARVAELTEQARAASAYRVHRAKAMAEAEAAVSEARDMMSAAVAASDVSAEDVVKARKAADDAAARHHEAARSLLRARDVAKMGTPVPDDGVAVHLAELERMRQQVITLTTPRAVRA